MKILAQLKKHPILWILPSLLILGIASYALAAKIVNAIDYRNNDFFTFWLAGRMVTLSSDPYSSSLWVQAHHNFGVTWIPNQAFVYPLPLSLVFAPLGLLPLRSAYIIWVALTILMILVALLLLLIDQNGARLVAIPLLVGLILFRPTILTLFHGQISGALLLTLAAVVFLWEKGHWGWGGFLLPVLMLKPNLGAPLLIILGAWLLLGKRYKALLAALLMCLLLLGLGYLQDPHWVSAYWNIGNAKLAQTFGGSPTVWGLGALVCRSGSTCMSIFGGVGSVLILLITGWFVFRKPDLSPIEMAALAVSVTLLLTPYTWTYDQVLVVLPLTALLLSMQRRQVNFFIYGSIFLGLDILTLFLLYFDTFLNVEILNVVLPLIVLGICIWEFWHPGGPAIKQISFRQD